MARHGSAESSPAAVIAQIESSAAFAGAVRDLALRLGRPEAVIAREGVRALREMVAAESPTATRAWTRMGQWLSRAYTVDTDRDNLASLRSLDTSQTLVFLPNHRSYLDPFVLRAVLAGAGFPANHVLGGSNLSFFPLGQIGQRTGLVFIRRQFKDDPVYKAMLGVYLARLIDEGANLEWYIEGGRTRTGKMRPPRMGILSYLLDAFETAGAQDVTFVPVSIIYDQQHEVTAIAAEDSGGTKAPESVKWAVRYARAQGTRRGKVHVRFGQPVSLRAILAQSQGTESVGEVRRAAPKVAFEVCHRINDVTPVTPAALVTLALLNDPDRAQTEQEMRLGLLPLAEYIRTRQLPLAGGMAPEGVEVMRTRSPEEGLRVMGTLVAGGVVSRYAGGLEPVYSIAPERYLEAAFYRNTLSHFFVTRSIVELALARVGQRGAEDLAAAVWTEALALRDLLKFEFFFSTKAQFAREVRAEMDLMDPGWADMQVSGEQILPLMADLPFLAAPRILSPFLEAYSVLADRLAQADGAVDPDRLVAECIGVARQRVLQRTLHSPESVSKDLFNNALQLAGNRGLLADAGADLPARRRAFAAELAEVVGLVTLLRGLSQGQPSEEEAG